VKLPLVAALAASFLTTLTGAPGSIAPAAAATPCAVAAANRPLHTWIRGEVTASTAVRYSRFRTTSSGWSLIKLGALNADLQLRLYDRSCHALATSQHRGRHFEQIYRRLPAGRYYVGVFGVSGATSSYALRFAPLRDGLRTLSLHAYPEPGSTGRLEVDGEVLNNRSTPTFFRWATVTFYSSTGRRIATADATFPQQYVRARSRVPFFADLAKPRHPYSRITVVTTTEALNGYPPPPRVTIVAGARRTDSLGRLHLIGRVTNDSTKPILLGKVLATLYDTYGNVRYVNEDPISPDELRPDRTGAFDVVFDRATGVNAVRFMIHA